MPITLCAANPTVIPSMAANPGMSVTNGNPGQKASTIVLNTQTMEELESSAPETALPVTTASSESQLGASYLNTCTHQTTLGNNISTCSSDPFAQENLKSALIERLNDKIYCILKEILVTLI